MKRSELILLFIILLSLTCLGSTTTKRSNENPKSKHNDHLDNEFNETFTDFNQDTNSIYSSSCSVDDDNCLEKSIDDIYDGNDEGSLTLIFTPETKEFGKKFLCTVFQESLNVYNPSSKIIHIFSYKVDTNEFSLSLPHGTLSIYPSQSVYIPILFTPLLEGIRKAHIMITTSTGIFNYEVCGEGIKNPYNLAPISLTQIQLGDSVDYDLMISNPKESNKKKVIINDIFVSNDLCSLSIKNTTKEEAWSVTLSTPQYVSTLTIQATRSGSFSDYIHIYTSTFHFVVPIEFTINANYITVLPSILVLKNIVLDRVVSTVFNVTNISKQPFHLISTQVFNTGKHQRSYSLEYSYVNVTLQPFESLPLTLQFTPYEAGEFKSYVLLMSNITNNEYRPYYLYYDVVAVNGSIIVKDIYMKINNPITTVQRKTKRAALLKSLCKSFDTYEEQRFSIENNYEMPVQILNIFTHTSVSENIKLYIYKNKDYIELTRYFEQYKNINLMPGSIMSNLYLFYFYNYTETANSLHLINFSSSIGSFTRHLFIYTGSLDVYIDNTNFPGMKREFTEFPSPVAPDFYVYNSIHSSMKELYNDKMNTRANANLVLPFKTLSFQSQRYKRITFFNNNPVTISYNITIADYPLYTVYLRVVESQNDLMSEKYIQKDLLPLTPGDVYTYILEPNEYIYFIIKLDFPTRKEFIQRMTTYPSGFITVHSQSPICFSSYINNLIVVKHPLQTINFSSSFSIPCGDIIFTPNPVFINVPYMTRYTSDSLRYMSSINNKTDIYDIYGFSTSLSYSIPIKYMTKNSNSTVVNFTYLGRFLYNTYTLCYNNLTLNYEYNSNEVRTDSNVLDSLACSLFPDLPEFTANKYVNPFTFTNYNMIFDMPVSEEDIERFVKRLLAYLIVFSQQNGVLEIKDFIMHTSVISHIHIPVVVVPQYVSIIQDNGILHPFNLSASSESIQQRYKTINSLSSFSPMESINIPTHILPFMNPVHYTTELKNVSINRAVNIPISLQNPTKFPVVFRIELDNKEDRYHEIFTKYIKNTTLMMNMNKRYSPDYLFNDPLEGQDSAGADMDPSMFLLNPLIPYGILKPNETRIVAFLTFHPSHTGTYAINLYVKNNLTNLEIYRYCGTGVGSDVQMIYKNQQDTQRHDELIMVTSLNHTNISNFTTYLQFTNPSSIPDQILGIYVENDIAPYVVVEDIYLNQTLVNGYIIDVPITYLYKCTESFTFTLNVITRFRPLIINITLSMDPNSVILCRQNYMSIHYSYIYEHKTIIVIILSVICCFFMASFAMILVKQLKNISYLYNVFPLMKYIHYIQDNVKKDSTYVYSLDGSNGIVLTSNTLSNNSESVQVVEPKNINTQVNSVSSPSQMSIPKSLSDSSLSTSLDEGTKQLSPLIFPVPEDTQDRVSVQSTNHSNVSTPSGHSKTSQSSISPKKQSRTATKLSGRSQKGSPSVLTNSNMNPLSPDDPEFYTRMLDNVTQLVYNDNLSNTTKVVESKTPTPTHVVSTRNYSPLVRNTKRSHDNGVVSPQRVHTPIPEPIIVAEQEIKEEDINLISTSSHSDKDVQIDELNSTSHENLDTLNTSTVSDNCACVLESTKIEESSVSLPSQSSISVVVESANENSTENQSMSAMDSIQITDKKNTTDLDIQYSNSNQREEESVKSSLVDTVDLSQTQKEACINNENNAINSDTVECSSLITQDNTLQVSSSNESISINRTTDEKEIEIVKEKASQKSKSDTCDSQTINVQTDTNEISNSKINKVNDSEVSKNTKDSIPLNDKVTRKNPISININVPTNNEKICENNKNDVKVELLESTNETNINNSSKDHELMTASSSSSKQPSNKKQEVQEDINVSSKKDLHKPSNDSTVSSGSIKQVPIITVNVPSIPKNNIQKEISVKTVSLNNTSSDSSNKKNQNKKEKNNKDEKCQEININKEPIQTISNIKTSGLSSPQRSNVITPKSDQTEKKSKREKKKEKANAKKNSSMKDISIHLSSNPSSRSNSTQPKTKEDKSTVSVIPQRTNASNHPSSVSSPTLSAHTKAAPYYLKSDPNPLYSDVSMNASSSISNSNSNGMQYYNSDEYIPSNDPGYEPIMPRYHDRSDREYPVPRGPYMSDMDLDAPYAYETKPEYYNRGYDDYYENPNVYIQEPNDNYYPSEEFDPQYDRYYNRRVMMNTMNYEEPQNENVIDYIPMIRRDVYAPEQFDGYDPSSNEMNTLYTDPNIDQLCNDQSIGFDQNIDEFNPSHPASILPIDPIDPIRNEMNVNNSNDFCEEDENIDAPLNYDIHNIIKVIDSDTSSSKSRSSSLSLINQAIQTIKDHTNSVSRTTSSKDLQSLSSTEVVKMEISKHCDTSEDTKQVIPTDVPISDQQNISINIKQESKLDTMKDIKSIPLSTTDISGIETLNMNPPAVESTVMEAKDVSESKSSSFSSAYNTNASVASNTMSFQDVPGMHSNSITEANYMYNDPSVTPVSHFTPTTYPRDMGMNPYHLSSGMPPNMNMPMRPYYGAPINRDIPYNRPINRPVYPPNYYNSIPSYRGQPVYDIDEANMNDYDYIQDPYDPDYYNYVDHPATMVNRPVPNRFIRGNNLSMNYPLPVNHPMSMNGVIGDRRSESRGKSPLDLHLNHPYAYDQNNSIYRSQSANYNRYNNDNNRYQLYTRYDYQDQLSYPRVGPHNNNPSIQNLTLDSTMSSSNKNNNNEQQDYWGKNEE